MNTSTRNFLSMACLVIFFFLAIASSVKNAVYHDADKWIPKDFDPNNTTLLIEKHILSDRQNRKMTEFLQQHFPFPYEIVDKSDIENRDGKYDTKKYRFGILWRSQETFSSSAATGDHRAWDMYGYFIDRSTGTTYPSTTKNNVYGDQGYKPVFNSIRNQFQKK
jgi:hypothetical protein